MSASAVMSASSNAPCRTSLSPLSSTSRSHIEVSDLLEPGKSCANRTCVQISLVLVGVGHDRRFSNEVFHFREDRWEPWSVPEIGWPNPVGLDGLGVDRPIRVDPGAPRLALAPAL